METVGERIGNLRRERGLSLAALADQAGMTSQGLWNLENNVVGKTFEKLALLAKALGCRIDDLFPEMDAPEGANVSEGKTVCADGFEDETMEGWAE